MKERKKRRNIESMEERMEERKKGKRDGEIKQRKKISKKK